MASKVNRKWHSLTKGQLSAINDFGTTEARLQAGAQRIATNARINVSTNQTLSRMTAVKYIFPNYSLFISPNNDQPTTTHFLSTVIFFKPTKPLPGRYSNCLWLKKILLWHCWVVSLKKQLTSTDLLAENQSHSKHSIPCL